MNALPALTPEQRAAISSTGGKAAQRADVAHRWTSDTAREAGRKGGKASYANRNGIARGETSANVPTTERES